MLNFKNKSLHSIFEERAVEFSRRPAVSWDGQSISYSELNIRANKLARYLTQSGVKAGDHVALYFERSINLVVALVAVLKSGAAYVPIDPRYPEKRIKYMLADSQSKLVLTDTDSISVILEENANLAEIQCVLIDQLTSEIEQGEQAQNTAVSSDASAYVIYTSGTTGEPKGVLVSHENVLALFESVNQKFDLSEKDSWTLFHSYCFDFSVWEIWGALLFGGRVVVVPYALSRSPNQFYNFLKSEKITVLSQTPTAFRQVITEDAASHDKLDNLRYVIFGGEELSVPTLRPWLEKYGDDTPQLINMYGITETTVHVTYRRIFCVDAEQNQSSPIGRPLAHLSLYLLDEKMNSVADGEIGSLYVAGEGLSKGYLNKGELTKAAFIEADVGLGGLTRLYKTGDLAKRDRGGEFFYMGRSDDQISMSGFRIEPTEVESKLCAHDAVSAALVLPVTYKDDDIRLVAFCETNHSTDAEGMNEQLRVLAEKALPIHMRPSSYVLLGTFPLTGNGKIDKQVLLKEFKENQVVEPNEPSNTCSTEEKVKAIWQSVLNLSSLESDLDFFDMGGTSLALMRIFREVNQAISVELDLTDFFDLITVDHMVSMVKKSLGANAVNDVEQMTE